MKNKNQKKQKKEVENLDSKELKSIYGGYRFIIVNGQIIVLR